MEAWLTEHQKLLRCLVSAGFIAYMMAKARHTESVDLLGADECIVDQIFEWTSSINDYLFRNVEITNEIIIYCSFLMDAMVLSFLALFMFYWHSFRVMIAYLLFFCSRAIVQNIFFMGRYQRYLWGDPGIYSVVVPYARTDDFYFSGHIGTCFLLFLELKAQKWHRLKYFPLFVMVN